MNIRKHQLYPIIVVAVVIFMAAVLSLWSKVTDNGDLPQDQVVIEEYEILTYEGDGLKFDYPSKYTRGPQGLWLNERYHYYVNPRVGVPSDLAPDINVYPSYHDDSIEDYLQTLYDSVEDVVCEDIVLDEKNYCRWDNIFNEYSVVNYVVEIDGQLIIFRSFFEGQDQQELQDMISTLEILP